MRAAAAGPGGPGSGGTDSDPAGPSPAPACAATDRGRSGRSRRRCGRAGGAAQTQSRRGANTGLLGTRVNTLKRPRRLGTCMNLFAGDDAAAARAARRPSAAGPGPPAGAGRRTPRRRKWRPLVICLFRRVRVRGCGPPCSLADCDDSLRAGRLLHSAPPRPFIRRSPGWTARGPLPDPQLAHGGAAGAPARIREGRGAVPSLAGWSPFRAAHPHGAQHRPPSQAGALRGGATLIGRFRVSGLGWPRRLVTRRPLGLSPAPGPCA